MPLSKSKLLKHLSAFFIFLGLSIYLTFPLVLNLNTYIPGLVDELYVTWILNWNIHAITTNIFSLFQGNTFYPFNNSISFSDPQLSSSLIALIPVLIFEEPIIAYSFNFLLSFGLLGFSTYLLVYFLTKDFFSSFSSGVVFGFSTHFLLKLGQLQVLTIYWIPLSLLCYLAFIKIGKFRYFLLTIFFFYLQFINSFQPAYFLLFVLIAITILEIVKGRKKIRFFISKKTVLSILFVTALCIPIILPYYETSKTFNYTRDIREAIHTANRPEHFFLNLGRSRIGPFFNTLLYQNPGIFIYDGYRGFAHILLTFIVLGYAILKKGRSVPSYFMLFIGVGLSTYIISLGPALQFGGKVIKEPFLIPLPYSILYYIAPGFNGFRNSGRWELYEVLAFCIAIGIFLSTILRKRKLLKITVNILICIIVIAEFTFPIVFEKVKPKNEIPDVYNFLKEAPNDTVMAEFPIYNWDMAPYAAEENMRLYYSTFHFRRTVNGAAGFSPPPWQELVTDLASSFPKYDSVDRLKKLGVNYIVVHENEFDILNKNNFSVKGYSIPNSKVVKNMLSENVNVEFIERFNNKDSVYKLTY